MTSSHPVRAAGCLVWCYGDKEPEVLLVHRPRWEDWSFPKGKLDPGETAIAAAVREVEEETGLRVRLGAALPDHSYLISGGLAKVVSYWTAKPPKSADISTYERNAEIDDLRWFPVSKALRKLTYVHDVEMLKAFTSSSFDSTPLIVVRHARAQP
ncbi:MAG: NUDIX hydrolase [Nocardioidaceae bacterium]